MISEHQVLSAHLERVAAIGAAESGGKFDLAADLASKHLVGLQPDAAARRAQVAHGSYDFSERFGIFDRFACVVRELRFPVAESHALAPFEDLAVLLRGEIRLFDVGPLVQSERRGELFQLTEELFMVARNDFDHRSEEDGVGFPVRLADRLRVSHAGGREVADAAWHQGEDHNGEISGVAAPL